MSAANLLVDFLLKKKFKEVEKELSRVYRTVCKIDTNRAHLSESVTWQFRGPVQLLTWGLMQTTRNFCNINLTLYIFYSMYIAI